MASKTSSIPRREPRKHSAIVNAGLSRSGRQSQPTPSGSKTKLPTPSQSTIQAPSKKHLHSRSLAVPTPKAIKPTRPRSAPFKPKAKDKLEVVEASHRVFSSLSTPTSAERQSPAKFRPAHFQTPKAPKKESRSTEIPTIAAQAQRPNSPSKSPYLHAHIGDACIHGALVHELRCGHKVMTRIPEQCKSNCRRPLPQYIEKYANAKNESKAFICAGCVEEYVEKHRQAKRVMFLESVEKIKGQMGGIPEGWVECQLEYWERVWKNDSQKERTEFAKLGDLCACIPGEPAPLESGLTKDGGQSTASLLPVEKRSKKDKASPPPIRVKESQ